MIRIDKFLCDCNLGTRSEVKKIIKKGIIKINNVVITDCNYKFDENSCMVKYNDKLLKYEKYSYFLFYKPKGCVTAKKDNLHKTVMDFLPKELLKDFSPVGRLDLDTEGALLITNDGSLNHHLMSPSHHVDKTYFAVLDKEVPHSAVEYFLSGADIGDDKPCKPAKLTICADNISAYITISEGRYHQVKRMFKSVGCEVIYLRRESISDLTLEGLEPGEYRKLDQEEINNL